MTPDDPRHGLYAGAVAHRKQHEPLCPPCEVADRRWNKAARLDRERGNPRMVTLGVRAWTIVANAPRDQLYRATGIRVDKLIRLEQGGPGQRVYRTTRDRLLRASFEHFWTPVGVQRRLRALTRLGYSMRALAALTGIDPDGMKRLRMRPDPQFVRREFAEAVIAAYDALHMRPAPDGVGASRARALAAAHGWPPPFAFDDIDDPAESPPVGRDRFDHDAVDPVVVQRFMSGEWRIPTTKAEKFEITSRWLARGRSLRTLADATGWKVERYDARRDGAA